MFICGSAYEAGGLFWAARANVLASLNQVLSDYWDNGYIAPQASVCAQKLAWIEIELGRVACAMSWMQLADLLASAGKLDDTAQDRFREVLWNQDAVLGILLTSLARHSGTMEVSFAHSPVVFARAARGSPLSAVSA